MTTLTVSDISVRVQRQFGDEAAVQVTGEDIIRWINDAQKEACNQIPNLYPTVSYLQPIVGTLRYDVPSTLFSLNRVYYKDSSIPSYYSLQYLSPYTFNQTVDGWDGTTYQNGVPTVYTREANQLVIFPPPREATVNGIKIDYGRYSIPITDDSQTPDLPEYLDQFLIDFCMNRAYEMDEDWAAADRMGARLQSTLAENTGMPEERFHKGKYAVVGTTEEDYRSDAI